MNSFELQPVLSGELLELRPLLPADFEALYRCASDPLIWEQHPQSTRYQRDIFQGFFDGAMASGGAFAVFDRATEAMIGSSRFYDLDAEKSRVTIGYTFLTREHWGGRFNRELKTLMLEHAFRFVEQVFFEIGECNRRSQQAIQRIGARLWEKQGLDGHAHLVYRIDEAAFREVLK